MYRIVFATTINELEKRVNDLIDIGCTIQGNLIVTLSGFYQVMMGGDIEFEEDNTLEEELTK